MQLSFTDDAHGGMIIAGADVPAEVGAPLVARSLWYCI
jgi:hypothetical protein